jgi:hypothetical protein
MVGARNSHGPQRRDLPLIEIQQVHIADHLPIDDATSEEDMT